MRKIFILVLAVLVAASALTWMTLDGRRDSRVRLSWRTDPGVIRYEQAELFQKWQVEHGRKAKDGGPLCEVSVDSASNQSSLIQAVSGMGGDIIDALVYQYQPMGLCTDLTDAAKQMGFTLDRTYPAFATLMTVDGRQYAASANAFCRNIWANVDTFRKYGLEPPPEEWTPEEFEAIGKEFVKRANAGKERQEVFFTQPLLSDGYHFAVCFARSLGVDLYNETLTGTQLDDPAFLKLYRLLYRWTYVDRLCPTPAESASMTVDSSLGGLNFSQFVSGKFALITTVRSEVIWMRRSSLRPHISTSQMPMYEFKNMPVSIRSLICYRGSHHKDDVMLFFKYLADREYNEEIIRTGDGLPPNPKFALDNPEFLAPPAYPNEGNLHANELKWAMNIGYAMPYSPYVPSEGRCWLMLALERYSAGLNSAEEAVAYARMRYADEFRQTVERNPKLRKKYLADLKLQEKIDTLKKEGKPIPLSWIKNPFYRGYYRAKNRIVDDNKEKAR